MARIRLITGWYTCLPAWCLAVLWHQLSVGDFKLEVLRGPNASAAKRLMLALLGGILVGFAARLARGCTGGLALVGGAELAVGSWTFMISVLAGGYAAAYFVRKQWI